VSDDARQGRGETDARPREDAAGRQDSDREAERGDVAEPDAPTASEENEGMSSILDADPLLGIQDDAGDV
jgi:hypothetical protein